MVIDNLARAFHLPRPKAKAAILEVLGSLTPLLDEQTLSRPALARLVELLGKHNYEQALEDPTLIGATSTQVIGTEALTALAGHSESARIAARTSAASGVSPMIAEYLLPVVTAMFMGALSQRTRPGLLSLARNGQTAASTDNATEAHATSALLPVGRGSSGQFSGATVITSGTGPERDELYRNLAERLRNGGAGDRIGAVRQVLAEGLGVRTRHAPWLARAQKLAVSTLQSAGSLIQERLRKPRSR